MPTSSVFDDLGEHAASRARVQESDAAGGDPGPRLGLDQLDPGSSDSLQGRVDVLDRVGDVVQAGALAGDELADRGVRAERPQELDVAVADVEQERPDPLRLDRLAA